MNFFFMFIGLLNYISCQNDLRMVIEAFRHGARGPYAMANLTTDIYQQKWKGLAELTPSGMRQHFLLGHQLRNKYVIEKKFLSPSFSNNEIHIVSTNVNRTIMSANSQLNGLYPPGTGPSMTLDQTKNAVPPTKVDDLAAVQKLLQTNALQDKMQIFPIHVLPSDTQFLDFYSRCKGIKDQENKNIEEPELQNRMKNFNKTYFTKFQKVIKFTDPNYFMNFKNFRDVFDAYISDYFDQRDLSNLGIDTKAFFDYSLDFFKYNIFDVLYGSKNNYSARVATSPWAYEVLNYFNRRIKLDNEGKQYTSAANPKLALYSAHDTTLSAMGLFFQSAFKSKLVVPIYASSLIIEFSRVKAAPTKATDKDYFVEITMNNEHLYSGAYSEFKNKLNDVLIPDSEVNAHCGFNTKVVENVLNSALLIILGVVAFILLLWVIYLLCRKKKINDIDQYNEV